MTAVSLTTVAAFESVGALAAVLGYFAAQWLDASITGTIATTAGTFFLFAFLLSPRHGLLARALARRRVTTVVVAVCNEVRSSIESRV